MRYFFSVLIAVLFISCEESPITKSIELDEEFLLRAGDTGIINDLQFSLKVESINDSRCPIGAQCIWAGSADIVLTLDSEMTGVITDTLRSFDKPIIEFAQFTIELLDVTPYREINGNQKLSKKEKVQEARLLVVED